MGSASSLSLPAPQGIPALKQAPASQSLISHILPSEEEAASGRAASGPGPEQGSRLHCHPACESLTQSSLCAPHPPPASCCVLQTAVEVWTRVCRLKTERNRVKERQLKKKTTETQSQILGKCILFKTTRKRKRLSEIPVVKSSDHRFLGTSCFPDDSRASPEHRDASPLTKPGGPASAF